MTLVILAAGMGSRYGGLKQIDPITDNGAFIIDFSIYDAISAGFDKVVFVIKKENYEDFKDTIGKRFEDKIKVEYAFQDICDLPIGFSVPEGRVKPWGTTHAMLCAKRVVNEPFAVINADDFYGKEAFMKLAEHLNTAKQSDYCMVGYKLSETITENGSVSRGVCTTSADRKLLNIVERTKIYKGDEIFFELDGIKHSLAPETTVSMNCWGFTPDIFEYAENGFIRFLCERGTELGAEYYLPSAVEEFMRDGLCEVSVYKTSAKWFGVTYKEDKERVKKGIKKLIDNGEYPETM